MYFKVLCDFVLWSACMYTFVYHVLFYMSLLSNSCHFGYVLATSTMYMLFWSWSWWYSNSILDFPDFQFRLFKSQSLIYPICPPFYNKLFFYHQYAWLWTFAIVTFVKFLIDHFLTKFRLLFEVLFSVVKLTAWWSRSRVWNVRDRSCYDGYHSTWYLPNIE